MPFDDVGWECGITPRASDYASFLVSSDLQWLVEYFLSCFSASRAWVGVIRFLTA